MSPRKRKTVKAAPDTVSEQQEAPQGLSERARRIIADENDFVRELGARYAETQHAKDNPSTLPPQVDFIRIPDVPDIAPAPVDVMVGVESATTGHRYISPWCAHGDHESCAESDDAYACLVCDARCACECHQ